MTRICKDPSKKFCPSCGGPTLIRASISTHAPTASHPTARTEVHLKQNFQYRTRGTIYSLPAPKPGSAKGGPKEELVLREDQKEFMKGLKMEQGRRGKEERELERAVRAQREGKGGLGSWNDPDVSRRGFRNLFFFARTLMVVAFRISDPDSDSDSDSDSDLSGYLRCSRAGHQEKEGITIMVSSPR
jgi:hypothetical protein